MSKSISKLSISVIETQKGYELEIEKEGTIEDFALMWEMLNENPSDFVKNVKALLRSLAKDKEIV